MIFSFLPKFTVTVEVDSPHFGGKAEITVTGPVDTDRDGNPEVFVAVKGPISVPSTKIEIPLAILFGPVQGALAFSVAELTRRGLFKR